MMEQIISLNSNGLPPLEDFHVAPAKIRSVCLADQVLLTENPYQCSGKVMGKFLYTSSLRWSEIKTLTNEMKKSLREDRGNLYYTYSCGFLWTQSVPLFVLRYVLQADYVKVSLKGGPFYTFAFDSTHVEKLFTVEVEEVYKIYCDIWHLLEEQTKNRGKTK